MYETLRVYFKGTRVLVVYELKVLYIHVPLKVGPHNNIYYTLRYTYSNCRTAGRYATPAALYLFLHTRRADIGYT